MRWTVIGGEAINNSPFLICGDDQRLVGVRLNVVYQLSEPAQGCRHKWATIVGVEDDGVSDIPLLQGLVQSSRIAIRINCQHEQLANLLRLSQVIDIHVDALA